MKKILIVEDEIPYLELLSSQLTQKGYLVIEATNGKDGLEKARLEKPDLILLDIRMPQMDGMEMLSRLRKQESDKHANVVVLTNIEPDEKIIGKVFDNLPTYYFIKSDIQLADLLKKIKQLLTE